MSEVVEEQDKIEAFAAQIERSDLFSIVIEGKDDLLVYTEFEQIYEDHEPMVDVLPVHGRNTVLGIFNRLKATPHLQRTIFIVDKDQWVIKGIDSNYIHDRIICTHGYSFENDIFIDGNLENDMKTKNAVVFNEELPTVLHWYALEMDRILNGNLPLNLSMHIENLFNQADIHTAPQAGETFPTAVLARLQTEYPQLLRGKTLLQFYKRVMNKRDGFDKRDGYGTNAIIESVCKHKGSCLSQIFQKVDNLVKTPQV
ncbi:DUF4435 domain-containing protein [Acinetobacter johnsonii]|uniref:DUF4435 domain-containing protein n=1 Tax=Acinetobacter johnsonii TaxID=40214 RepID=UPI0010296483|nr:DUF4435 domain-containing protein [Acinetobacter johnsonii]RZN91895.1 DUF4435 domain-containing protein [Acinetobacter johnsonii]